MIGLEHFRPKDGGFCSCLAWAFGNDRYVFNGLDVGCMFGRVACTLMMLGEC